MTKAYPHPGYDGLTSILRALARRLSEYRKARVEIGQLQSCLPEDLGRISRELGLNSRELLTLAQKGPHAADLVDQLLTKLGVDSSRLSRNDPSTMRDLQRLCSTCAFKRRCQSDLINEKAAMNFREYCPNAFTIDALLAAKK
jgi:hypothetical protein